MRLWTVKYNTSTVHYVVLYSICRSEFEVLSQPLACRQREVSVGEESAEEARVPAAIREGRECPGARDEGAVEDEVLAKQERAGAHVHALQHRVDEHLQPDRRHALGAGRALSLGM